MIKFTDFAADDEVYGTIHILDLQVGIIDIGNCYTHLPISTLEYREYHPTRAKIGFVETETEIRFDITDDYGRHYTVTATDEDMKHPVILRELAICKTLQKKLQMTEKRLAEIMESDVKSDWEGCNALTGLNIIAKYLPKSGIEGADHDIIFAATVNDILEAGLTEEDAIKLRTLNWMIDETNTGLACFV